MFDNKTTILIIFISLMYNLFFYQMGNNIKDYMNKYNPNKYGIISYILWAQLIFFLVFITYTIINKFILC